MILSCLPPKCNLSQRFQALTSELSDVFSVDMPVWGEWGVFAKLLESIQSGSSSHVWFLVVRAHPFSPIRQLTIRARVVVIGIRWVRRVLWVRDMGIRGMVRAWRQIRFPPIGIVDHNFLPFSADHHRDRNADIKVCFFLPRSALQALVSVLLVLVLNFARGYDCDSQTCQTSRLFRFSTYVRISRR